MNKTQRLYGFFLSLTHIVTLWFWRAFDFDYGLSHKLQNLEWNPWPFIPEGHVLFIQEHAVAVTSAYILLSFLTPLLFLFEKPKDPLRLGAFTLTLFIKLAIFFSSYDFMGNYHYMGNLLLALYVVSGAHLLFLQISLALFYFGAGLLKFNAEWITGSALLRETFLQGFWLQAACVYVILLETVLIWFLFAKNKYLRLITFAQLVVFHIFSWHIVGFYYPSVMFLLLTVFLLYRPTDFNFKNSLPKFAPVYFALFLAAQLYPKLLNKNEALTAEGRMLSLNMLDAKTECLASFELPTQDGYLYLDQPLSYAIRIRCDPLVYFNYAKKLCAQSSDVTIPSVKINLKSRKQTDYQDTWVIRDQEMCDKEITYSIFLNDWVHASHELSAPTSAPEKAYSHWRENPQRTGESRHLMKTSFTTTSLPFPFQENIHSAGKSSPIAFKSLWFVGSDSGSLYAFDNSSFLWRDYFPKPVFGFHGSGVTTEDGDLYLGAYDGILHKIRSKDGKRIWSVKLGSAIGSSPLLVNGSLYVAVENLPDSSTFFALDPRNGAIRWSSNKIKGLAHASLSYHAKSDQVFGATGAGEVISFHSRSGKEMWRISVSGKIISTPLVTDETVVIVSTEGDVQALNVRNGTLRWHHQLSSGSRASPSYHSKENILIVPSENGDITALQASDGAELWRKVNAHLHISSGLIARYGKADVYIDQCQEKTLCFLNVKTGAVLESYSLPESFSSTPMLKEDGLYITLDGSAGLWRLGENVKTAKQSAK